MVSHGEPAPRNYSKNQADTHQWVLVGYGASSLPFARATDNSSAESISTSAVCEMKGVQRVRCHYS